MKFRKSHVLLAAMAGVGLWLHQSGRIERWLSREPDQIDAGRALAAVMESLNADRALAGLDPLVADAEVDGWVTAEAAAIVPGAEGIERFLGNVQRHIPGVKFAKAEYAESRDAEALVASLADWPEAATDPDLTHLCVHVFARSSWNRFRVAAVAVCKLPRFSPALLDLGKGAVEAYDVCPQCGRAQRIAVERRSLWFALHCNHCAMDYDLFAMRLDGSYLRVNTLLNGYEALAAFPENASQRDEMLAIWRAVRASFDYSLDMRGARGPQDTWQTATETARFRNGDCEDTAIFLTDWLLSRGIDARVACGMSFDPQSGNWVGHAWSVARVGGEEFILESTGIEGEPDRPPRIADIGQYYQPIAQFDRDRIYFRKHGGWTPRYWSESEWRGVEFPRAPAATLPAPRIGATAIGARCFGRDRIATPPPSGL